MNASILRGFGVLTLLCLLPRLHALTILSATQTISATGHNSSGYSGAETQTAPNFVPFDASVGAIGLGVGMTSAVSDHRISLNTRSSTFLASGSYSPGTTWADNYGTALFDVTFSVDQQTNVVLAGYRDKGLHGLIDASLTSSSGVVPLNWTSFPYFNNLEQPVSLLPGIYTLRGETAVGTTVSGSMYDGSHVQLQLELTVVPDAGSSLFAFVIGISGLVILRRRLASRT